MSHGLELAGADWLGVGHGSTGGASRGGGGALDLYEGLRVAALGCPLQEDEERVARDTPRLLGRWLRLDPGDAAGPSAGVRAERGGAVLLSLHYSLLRSLLALREAGCRKETQF